jgi:hypothetical protein
MSKEILPIAQRLNRLRHERRLGLSQLAIDYLTGRTDERGN